MAKINYIKINNTISYIENIAYLSELPTANADSADFVSVNNELYVKQVNGTTYNYVKIGGSSAEIITINFSALSNNMATATITTTTYNKLVGADLVVVKAVIDNESSFYLLPQIESGMKIYGLVVMQGAEKIGQFQMIPVSSSMVQLNYIEQENASKSYVDNAIGGALQGDY